MISLLQHLLQEYKEYETKWEQKYGMGEDSFFCFGKKNYFIEKLCVLLLIIFSETFFKL